MKGRTGSARRALVGGLLAALVAGGAVAGTLAVKAKRDTAVREALSYLPSADREYLAGRFAEAVAAAAEAAKRHQANPTWFQPADEARIKEAGEFLARQLDLWKRVETAAAGTDADPAKARAELEKLIAEARAGAEKARPVVERIEPKLQGALA